jgi:hypothetical protein
MASFERKFYSLKADPPACADDQNCTHRVKALSGQLDPNRSGWVSLEYQPVSHPWVQRTWYAIGG